MYAPLVFNARVDRNVPVSGGISNTIITEFQTPSVRSSIANGTVYTGEFFSLENQSPDDFARLTYFIRTEYIWDYPVYNLNFSLDPVFIDVSRLIADYGMEWENFLPVFVLKSGGVASPVTVEYQIVSIDSSGVLRDRVDMATVYTSNSQNYIALSDLLPDYEAGDKLFINQFTINCKNYSPDYTDRYTTGFLSDTYVEPVDALNAPTRVELSSVPLVSILWNSIVDVFEIDLIPGLSLGTILLAIIGLPLLIWFLKLVAGG